ncbi:MBL fold metallo-hydrolase [Novosphingobium sp. FSY-8]|uniref:MBL fold metallo-hydrolase n=1 Tax=Novosphingobium ovatum TaxID=1908523 RepID=A0ABW9X9A2_9SPHN|nr:MBL fold metallo-hydrolase [Novosphingobium ovatum]NBC35104.1 MBL fold metallo-hydrolase [Novosphingobium ovatum]
MAIRKHAGLIATSVVALTALAVGGGAVAQAPHARTTPKPVRTYQDLERETGLKTPAGLAFGRMAVDVAGKDWPDTVSFRCYSNGGHVESGLKAPPATKVFDNVYYLGDADVSSWAIKTSQGIILIDALTTEADAQRLVVDGLRSVGLDARDIRYILVTHEHFDHFGGASLLKRLSGAKIGMSEVAWQGLARQKAKEGSPIPERDLVLEDGAKIMLGDTSVTAVLTPGHTPGTMSFIYPARLNGVEHMAATWGGNGFPSAIKDRFTFLESIEHFAGYTAKAGVDVELSIHGDNDDLIGRLERLRAGKGNSFVAGRERYLRFEEVYRLCSRARMADRGDF